MKSQKNFTSKPSASACGQSSSMKGGCGCRGTETEENESSNSSSGSNQSGENMSHQ